MMRRSQLRRRMHIGDGTSGSGSARKVAGEWVGIELEQVRSGACSCSSWPGPDEAAGFLQPSSRSDGQVAINEVAGGSALEVAAAGADSSSRGGRGRQAGTTRPSLPPISDQGESGRDRAPTGYRLSGHPPGFQRGPAPPAPRTSR